MALKGGYQEAPPVRLVSALSLGRSALADVFKNSRVYGLYIDIIV